MDMCRASAQRGRSGVAAEHCQQRTTLNGRDLSGTGKTPAIQARPLRQSEFPGIAQSVAVAPNPALDVLMVHGMCAHVQDWAEGSINELNSAEGIRRHFQARDQPEPSGQRGRSPDL